MTRAVIRRARALRRDETDVEYRLWYELRARRLNGYKFKRQHPVGPFFADFACRERRLIVELDGSQHAGDERDDTRTERLMAEGWSVLRFWNDEVASALDPVLNTILAALEGRLEPDVATGTLRYHRPICVLPTAAHFATPAPTAPSGLVPAPTPPIAEAVP